MYGSVFAIILEIVTASLLVVGIVGGIKKGFFKSLMDLIVLAAAVFAAVMVCRWCTGFLVERFYPKAEEKVLKAIENAQADLSDVDISAMGFDETHPDTLSDEEMDLLKNNAGIAKTVSALEKAGIRDSRIRSIIAKTLKSASKSGQTLNEALTDSARTITKNTLTVIVNVVLFLLVLVIVSILLQLLVNAAKGLLWKVDVLKSFDRFLGFILGAVLMLALIFIAFYLFRRIEWTAFEEAADQTLIASFLNRNNPIALFFD